MKKGICILCLFTIMITLLTACSSKKEVCSVEGCENEVYKNGLCPDHFVEKETAAVSKTVEDANTEEETKVIEETEIEETETEETETVESENILSVSELEKVLLEQACCVTSTKYLVQDEKYKSLYPDMLSAVIKNQSGTDIKNAVVAFVAWDENNFPIKIAGQFDFDGGSYVTQCDYGDVNMVDGATYGENKGMSISEDTPDIKTFKAIVVKYTDFDGNTWNNPYYNNWIDLLENKKLTE